MEKFPFTIDLVSTALLHLYRKIDWGAFSKSFKSPESRKDCKKEINSSINLTRKINKKNEGKHETVFCYQNCSDLL